MTALDRRKEPLSIKKRLQNKDFFLILDYSKKRPKTRVFYRVSKKTINSAVKRNLLKRRVRVIFQENNNLLPLRMSIFFGLVRDVSKLPFKEVKSSLEDLLRSIK